MQLTIAIGLYLFINFTKCLVFNMVVFLNDLSEIILYFFFKYFIK
jgi:hypothetical protein